MILFNWHEILDIIIMTLAVGFIFKDLIPMRHVNATRYEDDPVAYYQNMHPKVNKYLGTWDEWKWAIISVAPGIILHEFGHKFVALSFGLTATFQAAYSFLGLGIVLKLINFPLLFFVPAYIAISGNPTALQSALIAFAGPCVNLILWALCKFILSKRKLGRNATILVAVTQRLNGFLFIFNMIPLPGFDGLQVYLNLIRAFTG